MDVHTSFVLFNRIKMLEKPESSKITYGNPAVSAER